MISRRPLQSTDGRMWKRNPTTFIHHGCFQGRELDGTFFFSVSMEIIKALRV
ncbi:hypothetical protein EXN66_Car008207 [Channa argus]|uniref:Uncharacterized protein n=1 Tax=Channa argus TaxID=215402 RepID=A0A6G1PQA7_CHAAH|nr:hypothetical protein EXN66_Car008207 [Channa argus]